jgi:hypothetical protein
VLGVNTCLGTLRPGHLWSLRSVDLNKIGLGRAPCKSIQPRLTSVITLPESSVSVSGILTGNSTSMVCYPEPAAIGLSTRRLIGHLLIRTPLLQ